MEVTWLGQAGLLFEIGGSNVMIDPYLSDSVSALNPNNKRRIPVDERFLHIKPDVIILTHNHLDHTDPQTLSHYLTENAGVLVLASMNSWAQIKTMKGNNNYVLFNRHAEWTHNSIRFKAVKAQHSDEHAIGVIIRAEDRCIYIAGDTLYSTEVLEDLPDDINYIFLPINGYGNNMNMTDAKRICEKTGAIAIPMHCGMFDDIDMNRFEYSSKIVPEAFHKIKLNDR